MKGNNDLGQDIINDDGLEELLGTNSAIMSNKNSKNITDEQQNKKSFFSKFFNDKKQNIAEPDKIVERKRTSGYGKKYTGKKTKMILKEENIDDLGIEEDTVPNKKVGNRNHCKSNPNRIVRNSLSDTRGVRKPNQAGNQVQDLDRKMDRNTCNLRGVQPKKKNVCFSYCKERLQVGSSTNLKWSYVFMVGKKNMRRMSPIISCDCTTIIDEVFNFLEDIRYNAYPEVEDEVACVCDSKNENFKDESQIDTDVDITNIPINLQACGSRANAREHSNLHKELDEGFENSIVASKFSRSKDSNSIVSESSTIFSNQVAISHINSIRAKQINYDTEVKIF